MPASLVVVRFEEAVLMVFNSWRRQWELPGGMREPGETARQLPCVSWLKRRVLRQSSWDFVAVAEVDLRRPGRREYTAIYRTDLQGLPQLVVNEEASAFLWWDPRSSATEQMNPIDAEMVNARSAGSVNETGEARFSHDQCRQNSHADDRVARVR